jgi:surface protein
MSWMFREAKTFNQDIGNWNVGNVNAMTGMLRDAKLFNQDLNKWALRIDCCTDECADYSRTIAIKPVGFHVWSAGFLVSVTFTSL